MIQYSVVKRDETDRYCTDYTIFGHVHALVYATVVHTCMNTYSNTHVTNTSDMMQFYSTKKKRKIAKSIVSKPSVSEST